MMFVRKKLPQQGLLPGSSSGSSCPAGLGVAVVPVGWMTAAPDHLRTAIA